MGHVTAYPLFLFVGAVFVNTTKQPRLFYFYYFADVGKIAKFVPIRTISVVANFTTTEIAIFIK